MKIKVFTRFFTSIVCLIILQGTNNILKAQIDPDLQVISTQGGYYMDNLVTIEWTLGEPVSETLISGDYILTQGFHQQIYFAVSIEDVEDKNYEISVFPNPTVDYINLKINKQHSGFVKIDLFDMNGKHLLNRKVEGDSEQINMNQYAVSMYFLKISDPTGRILKTYQIQKAQ